jgi:hypothetical protein
MNLSSSSLHVRHTVLARSLLYGADEIQPQKFPDMQTHVSCWAIGSEP